jgi:DNA-binding transcriptional LysR family regulator
VPRLIVRLRKLRPDLVITLRDMSTVEQLDALRSDKIDLGFVRLPVARDLETRPVIDDRLMLVSPASHALPVKLALERCRDEPFVLLSQERSPTLHAQALALCAKHGFHPRIVQTVPEVTTAVALVRAGLGLDDDPSVVRDRLCRRPLSPARRKRSVLVRRRRLAQGRHEPRAGALSVVAGSAAIVRRSHRGESVKLGVMLGPNGQMLGLDCRPAAVKNYAAYSLERLGVTGICQEIECARQVNWLEEAHERFSDHCPIVLDLAAFDDDS